MINTARNLIHTHSEPILNSLTDALLFESIT